MNKKYYLYFNLKQMESVSKFSLTSEDNNHQDINETNTKTDSNLIVSIDPLNSKAMIKEKIASLDRTASPVKVDLISNKNINSPNSSQKDSLNNFPTKENYFNVEQKNKRSFSPKGNMSPILNYYSSCSPKQSSNNIINYYSPSHEDNFPMYQQIFSSQMGPTIGVSNGNEIKNKQSKNSFSKSPVSFLEQQNFNFSPSCIFNQGTHFDDRGHNTSGDFDLFFKSNKVNDSEIQENNGDYENKRKHKLSEENEGEIYQLYIKGDDEEEDDNINNTNEEEQKNKLEATYEETTNSINCQNEKKSLKSSNYLEKTKFTEQETVDKVIINKDAKPYFPKQQKNILNSINCFNLGPNNSSNININDIADINNNEYYFPNKIGEGVDIETLKRSSENSNKGNNSGVGGYNNYIQYQINNPFINIPNVQPQINNFQQPITTNNYYNNYINNFYYNGDQYQINPNRQYRKNKEKIRTISAQDMVTTITANNKKIKRIDPNTYLNESLEYLSHNIFLLAKDQAGCRFLQKKLDENPKDACKLFYEAILVYLIQLIKDPFGNYFVQKLASYLNEEQIEKFLTIIAPNLLELGCDSHGTRVLQHLITCLRTPHLVNLFLNNIKPYVIPLLKELNGTHIIQKFINDYPKMSSSINEIIISNSQSLAMHRHGCCVLQKYLEGNNRVFKENLIKNLIQNALSLITDQFGNYVIQSILLLNEAKFSEKIAEKICDNIVYYSKHRYSSNVVEKCFDHCEKKDIAKFIEKLNDMGSVQDLILDEHGNYVIQKVLSNANKEIQNKVIEYIIPVLDKIREQTFGARLLNKLATSYPVINDYLDKNGRRQHN